MPSAVREVSSLKYLLLPLIFLAGVAIPLEAAMNARLKEAVGSPALSALISFLIGTAATLLLLATGWLGRGQLTQIGSIPWWAWLGGLLGVFIVVLSLSGLPKVGAAVLIAVTVFGQVLMSLAMDNFGWLGTPKTPINAWRIAGAVLLFVGVLLTNKK